MLLYKSCKFLFLNLLLSSGGRVGSRLLSLRVYSAQYMFIDVFTQIVPPVFITYSKRVLY